MSSALPRSARQGGMSRNRTKTVERERQSAPGLRARVEEIADRLHSASIHVLRRVHKQDEASGVGPARLSALSVLVFGGPMSLGQLASAERVKPPTMTRIVAGLKRAGLVAIVTDSQDARRLKIAASVKGTRLLQQARRRRIRYLADHLDELTETELDQMREAVTILERVLRTWR